MELQGQLQSYMLSVVIWKYIKEQSLSLHHLSDAFLCKNGLHMRSWEGLFFFPSVQFLWFVQLEE